ncbi:hypothetical protein [Methylibium sp.]|uniref:hypothetical protein n=1 Tax=Methylibium sp. TaxID=2067992 RepID=UPI003D0B4176
MKSPPIDAAFADTVPDALLDGVSGAVFADACNGQAGTMVQETTCHEIDTSLRLPTRQESGRAYRFTPGPDPYGRRGCDRPYEIIPKALGLRSRWIVWSVVSTVLMIAFATLLMD